jgi:hypothetical protein
MSTFNTIHIFGFGVVQVIGKNFNKQVPIADVQVWADACIDNVWSNKPVDNTGTKEYHAINIFNDLFADWQPNIKGEKGFRTKYDQLDSTLFDGLVTAVLNVPTP